MDSTYLSKQLSCTDNDETTPYSETMGGTDSNSSVQVSTTLTFLLDSLDLIDFAELNFDGPLQSHGTGVIGRATYFFHRVVVCRVDNPAEAVRSAAVEQAKRLSDLHHQHLAVFMGLCNDAAHPLCSVREFVYPPGGGTVERVLTFSPGLSLPERAMALFNAAKVLAHLHSKDEVHGHLGPSSFRRGEHSYMLSDFSILGGFREDHTGNVHKTPPTKRDDVLAFGSMVEACLQCPTGTEDVPWPQFFIDCLHGARDLCVGATVESAETAMMHVLDSFLARGVPDYVAAAINNPTWTLHDAAEERRAEDVKVLLEWGYTITAKGNLRMRGMTPFMSAARGGSRAVLEALLHHGASVHDIDDDGRTALHHAALHGRAEAVRTLLQNGADPAAKDSLNHDIPLHLAAREGRALALTALLECDEASSLVNTRDRDEYTPLILAVKRGRLVGSVEDELRVRVVRLLLDAGADPSLHDKRMKTAAIWARDNSNPIIAALLPPPMQRRVVGRKGKGLLQESFDYGLGDGGLAGVNTVAPEDVEGGQQPREHTLTHTPLNVSVMFSRGSGTQTITRTVPVSEIPVNNDAVHAASPMPVAAVVADPGRLHVVSFSDLALFHSLGEGGFGDVYKGRLNGSTVAVKQMKNVSGVHQLQAFIDEVSMLSSLHSPCLVRFIGACVDPMYPLCIVMEYVPKGEVVPSLSMPMTVILRIGLDVSNGLAYLHRKGIVHRDVKPPNCLDCGDTYKLTDFGISCSSADNASIAGTLRYMAPESFMGSAPHPSSDSFSYGVMMWHLMTGTLPFEDVDRKKDLRRPCGPIDPKWPLEITSIITECMSFTPEKRPSMAAVMRRVHPVGMRLHLLVHDDPYPLHTATKRNNEDDVVFLLEHRFAANVVDHNGRGCTSLYYAIKNNFASLAKLLIQRGDSSLGSVLSKSALILAAEHNQADVVLSLLEHGVYEKEDIQGALGAAITQACPSTVRALLEHGARITKRHLYLAIQADNAPAVTYLLEHGSTHDHDDDDGSAVGGTNDDECSQAEAAARTPLHVAAARGAHQTTIALLGRKASLNARDIDRNTPLHTAAMHGHNMICKLLLAEGADVSAVNIVKNTALHLGALRGHPLVVKALLEACSPEQRASLLAMRNRANDRPEDIVRTHAPSALRYLTEAMESM